MKTIEPAELDRQLTARSWTYDAAAGAFRSGVRRLEWEELIGVIVGLTFEDLMAYEVRQHEEWRKGIA